MSAGSPAAARPPRARRRTRTVPAASPPRLRALGLAWSTPARLWALLGAVTLSAILLFLSVSLGVADSGRAFQAIGPNSAPTINASLDLYFALSDMDADAANYLLLDGHPTANLTPVGVVARYEQRRQAASDLLVSAAHNAAYGESERRSILRMVVMTQIFDGDVAQAWALTDRGDRAGALTAYEQATDLMHAPFGGLLETALDLAAVDDGRLTAGYDSARSEEGRDVALIVVCGLLAIGSLAWLQLFLIRRTRRALSLPVLAAAALAVVLLAGAVSTLHANDDRLKVAKQDAYDSVYALRQLQAIAFDANADESRYLIDPARADTYEESFLGKSIEIAGFRQPVTIATYDAALARQLSALRSGGRPSLEGAFGPALGNITFPGERDAAVATLAAYAKYERDDRILRADVQSGNLAEAVRFDVSAAPNDSDGDFNAFDSALGGWIQINQRAFDQAIAAGSSTLNGWQLYPVLGAALVVVLAWLGVRPRLREYA